MPTVTVKLSPREFANLEAAAAKIRRNKSYVIRSALAAQTGKVVASFLDAARPYVGAVKGPGDLSTNKSRMKRYGASRSR
jgi:hypothetical protein